MKILVTGASGLLGGNIVRELIRRGNEVRIFVRNLSVIPALQGLKYDRFLGSLNKYEDLAQAAEGQDAIIHAAA
ncbi:MAG: NAD(P)H-binding protein [Bacteroidales bacterium]|nr:NAD(P)H-binding protein [Bacteroidales bacterium]